MRLFAFNTLVDTVVTFKKNALNLNWMYTWGWLMCSGSCLNGHEYTKLDLRIWNLLFIVLLLFLDLVRSCAISIIKPTWLFSFEDFDEMTLLPSNIEMKNVLCFRSYINFENWIEIQMCFWVFGKIYLCIWHCAVFSRRLRSTLLWIFMCS